MPAKGRRSAHAATIFLAASIAFLSFVLLRRLASSDEPHAEFATPAAPQYVRQWHSMIASGLTFGDTLAPIRVIEYLDLQCPACAEQNVAIRALQDRWGKKLSVTYVHLPLRGNEFSLTAAGAASCAHEQGKFEEFVDAIFRQQDSVGLRSWTKYAQDARVSDTAAFNVCVEKSRSDSSIALGLQTASVFNVSMTPTLIVNGWRYSGALGEAFLNELFERLANGRLPIGVYTILQNPSLGGQLSSGATVPTLQYSKSALTGAKQLAVAPVSLRILGDDGTGDADLSHLTSAVVTSDGRVFTLSRIGASILEFSADGKTARRVGRVGRGPMEFWNPTSIARITGDSLLIVDRGNERLSFTHRSGEGVRTSSISKTWPRLLSQAVGVLPSNTVVLHESAHQSEPPDDDRYFTDSISVLTYNAASGLLPLLRLPDAVSYAANATYFGREQRIAEHLRFSTRAHVVLWDTVIVTGYSSTASLSLISERGTPLGSLHLSVERRAVTQAMRAAATSRDLEMLRSSQPETRVNDAELERLVRATRFADSLPAFEALHVSPDNVLWIVDAIAPTDAEWFATGLRMDGSIVGRVSGPGSATPVAFGDRFVVLRAESEEGLVTLRVHSIIPR